MWPQWVRTPRTTPTAAAASAAATTTSNALVAASPAHPSFVFSTFKDVRSLLADDAEEHQISTQRKSVFHRVRVATAALRSLRSLTSSLLSSDPTAPSGDKRIVLYFTSLRIVRKTFEDCRVVRSILRGIKVSVDERDLSMDSRFLNELKGILGRRQLALPRVFIGGRYMGGADEIRQLHESGELKRYVEGAPPAEPGVCDRCGGARFVLCQICCGSHKFYSEKAGGFRSCGACNENGLVRCAVCCPCEAVV